MTKPDLTRIELLGLDRVLKRGTAQIIAEEEDALFIRDTVSGACLLACGDRDMALAVLDRHLEPECHLLMISDARLGQTAAERRSILLGYREDKLAGFVGEHLEGSMGLLFVFPEFRRRGYGAELEKLFIARTMAEGFVPFGQVEKDNAESLRLQEKLGMTRSEKQISWLWK